MEQDLCFTVWVGQQEKEIRNLKEKTTIADVVSALLREHLRTIFVNDERFAASLPYLCRSLRESFTVRLVNYDGSGADIPGNQKILEVIAREIQPTNYVLKMMESPACSKSLGRRLHLDFDHFCIFVIDELDEIEIIRGILLQDQRISEQKIILQSLDTEINEISTHQDFSPAEEIVQLEEIIQISDKLVKLQQEITIVEEKATILFDEIEQNKNQKVLPQRSATLPRKPKPSIDFYHGRSESDSSSESTNFYMPVKSNTIHHSATLPRRLQGAKPEVPFVKSIVIEGNRASLHEPAIRRDIEPEREGRFLQKWPSMNIIRRSVSEMHLCKETSVRTVSTKIDKIDTDSDTGISSLHSSDNEFSSFVANNLVKCETLV